MWRYRDFLPLGKGPISYLLPVGNTPLIAAEQLRKSTGITRLWLKDETRGPSGSNKDRATALVIEQAMREGADTVTCASTGNVAVSTAVGAAAAGLRAIVFVPEGVGEAKLRFMLQSGALVLRVRGGYEAAFQLSRDAAAKFGWIDRNTGVNPATLHAKKTVGLEIFDQLKRAPEVIVAPVGDGPTLCAIALAFRELAANGHVESMPRIIGVPAADPVRTIADGIAVRRPIMGTQAEQDVSTSGGAMVAVDDRSILQAMRQLAMQGGVIAEPAGAAAFAGLLKASGEGLVSPEESVVVLVTGSAFKAAQNVQPEREATTIDGSLDELENIDFSI